MERVKKLANLYRNVLKPAGFIATHWSGSYWLIFNPASRRTDTAQFKKALQQFKAEGGWWNSEMGWWMLKIE